MQSEDHGGASSAVRTFGQPVCPWLLRLAEGHLEEKCLPASWPEILMGFGRVPENLGDSSHP